ncbi:MAG: hypothetical protein CSA81_06395 [Acidobacteria bacterium]|nr:MAG: hypothetical protein CSA81_06395 [Acidobacteriota bacterium]
MNPIVAFDNRHLAIFETDIHGTIGRVNRIFEKITGYSASDMVGREPGFLSISETTDHILKDLDIDLRDGSGWHGHLICTTKSNEIFQVETTVVPLFNAANELTGLTWILRYLNDLIDIESQLIQAQRMEAVGALACGISHDFSNVLSIVSGFTSLALRSTEDDYTRRCLFNIMEASDRATDLVKQVLSFTNEESRSYVPISLRLMLKGLLKMIRSILPEAIDIQVEMGRDYFPVFGNPAQLHQVFINLTSNAAYAMRGKNGTLKIELDLADANEVPEAVSKQKQYDQFIKISIKDTGDGIEPEHLNRIFDPFFTTKERGKASGLGLSAVADILKKHSGSIYVESELGKGSVFTVILPYFRAELAKTDSPNRLPVQKQEKPIRVLFLDDEEILVEVISEGLRSYGFSVLSFTDSLEALVAFKQSPDEVDIVLTDLVMPKLSGIEFARQVMKIRPEIPVVLCTGFIEKEDREVAFSHGVKSVLMKPVLIEAIVKELSFQYWQAVSAGN